MPVIVIRFGIIYFHGFGDLLVLVVGLLPVCFVVSKCVWLVWVCLFAGLGVNLFN